MKNTITITAILLLSILTNISIAQQWERCPNQPNYPGLPSVIGNFNLTPISGSKILVASGNAISDFSLAMITPDGGNTWTTTGVPGANGATSARSGNYLYLGQSGNGAGNIYHSTDEGLTWTIDTVGLPMFGSIRYQVLKFYPFTGGIVAKLEGPSTTMIKLNTSSSWTQITNYPPNAVNTTAYYTNGDTVFTADGTTIFYTVDLGNTWTQFGTYTGFELNFDNNGRDVFIGLQKFASGTWVNAGIAHSANSGATWDTIPFTAVTYKRAKYVKYIDNQLYVGVITGFFSPGNEAQLRLFQSNDMGNTWMDLTYNLKDTFDTDAYDLTKVNNVLYVTTYSKGVLRLGTPSGIHSIESKLSGISVAPNPSKDFVQLEFSLAEAGKVTVSITDMQGKTMQNTQSVFKKGSNKISLNTSALAPGLYIARVEMGNSIAIKKIIVE